MKILVHPQPSMRSYSTGQWLLSKDSQIGKLRGYFKYLPEHEFVIMLPDEGDSVDLRAFRHNVWWPKNVQAARYHFDINDAKYLLDHHKPDLLLLEVPEHAPSWRVAGWKGPIVSIVNHADVFSWGHTFSRSDLLRQVTGAMESDLLVFHVNGTRDAWCREVIERYGAGVLDEVLDKITLWRGSFDVEEVPEGVKNEQTPLAINFISRLSDNPRTHFMDFIQACQTMSDRGNAAQVWIGDPNEAWSEEYRSRIITCVGPWGKDEYWERLWQSTCVPILWPQWEMHSNGFCHAIATENIVVSPAGPDYSYMPGVLISGEITPEKITQACAYALSLEGEERFMVIERQHQWLQVNRSIGHNIAEVRNALEQLVAV